MGFYNDRQVYATGKVYSELGRPASNHLYQAIRENKARIDGRFAELQTVTNEHDERAKTFDQQLANWRRRRDM